MGMWKDAYAVGNTLIDSQHKELFRMTDDLVAAVRQQSADSPVACARAVAFLKDYVVKHFADEEALQAALGDTGLKAHKALHQDFVSTVLAYEKSLNESNFDPKVVQQFAGTLIGWLIYHVVGEDGKITGMVAAAAPQVQDKGQSTPLVAFFAESACEVLGQMLNVDVKSVPDPLPISQAGDVNVSIGLVGDHPGQAEFMFPLVTALRIVQHMTMTDAAGLSDMMESALREIANIISGNAASKIAKTGCACDITPPKLYRGQHSIFKDSAVMKCDLGSLVISCSS
jgi:hemerythrin